MELWIQETVKMTEEDRMIAEEDKAENRMCGSPRRPSGRTPYFCQGHPKISPWNIHSLSVTEKLKHHCQTRLRSSQHSPPLSQAAAW